jgi:hypothetical protein
MGKRQVRGITGEIAVLEIGKKYLGREISVDFSFCTFHDKFSILREVTTNKPFIVRISFEKLVGDIEDCTVKILEFIDMEKNEYGYIKKVDGFVFGCAK